jgi:hypothetical protein
MKNASKGKALRYYATNVTILNLYSLAFPQLAEFPKNKIILNVGNADRYFQPKIVNDQWNEDNLFCYELITPSTDDMTSQFIASELNTFFKVQGGIENRLIKCSVLKPSISGVKSSQISYASSQKLSSWVHKYNSTLKSKPVINESGLGNLDIPKDLPSPNDPSTILFLKSCGIEIIEEVRSYEIFVLTELQKQNQEK